MKSAAEEHSTPLPSAEEQRDKAARKQKAYFEQPCPGYLLSLQVFHEQQSPNYLRELFKGIPEEEILDALPPSRRSESGKGRRPFPRRALLRAVVARLVYRIPSYAALAQQLETNVGLKFECDFDMRLAAPGEDCLAKFAQLLGQHTAGLEKGLGTLVDELSFQLPGFGENTSWDSMHNPIVNPPEEEDEEASHTEESSPVEGETADTASLPAVAEETPSEMAASEGKPEVSQEEKSPAVESLEADWGKKTYERTEEKVLELKDGRRVKGLEVKKETVELFGGKIHLIVDNQYRLPLAIEVTPQSQGDAPMIAPMYRKFCEEHPCIEVKYAMADKAGDSLEVHRVLNEELGIVPIIPLREFPNREAPADEGHEFPQTVYDRDRVTHMLDPRTGQYEELVPWGYDSSRQAIKYRCPCQRLRKEGRLGEQDRCPFFGARCGASQGKSPCSIWVYPKENWRYYCPVPRESKRWTELYKQRTTVERVNSLGKGPFQIGDKRLRSLTTASAEAHLACLVLCARAKVALDWGAPEKVGSAVSTIPYRRHRMAI